MYQSYFGFREMPFAGGVNPGGFYFNRNIREVYNGLLQGIYSGIPLLVLTGQAGTGKTALVKHVSADLDQQYKILFACNRYPGLDELIHDFCKKINVDCSEKTLQQRIRLLSDYLVVEHRQGRHNVLVVDAMEDLSQEVIAKLFLLMKQCISSNAGFQSVLIGSPALDQVFEGGSFRRCEIGREYHLRLDYLDSDEVTEYINFRIRSAGCQQENPFSAEALRRIAYHSNGNLRIVNILCSFALLETFLDNQNTVTDGIIDAVAQHGLLRKMSACEVFRGAKNLQYKDAKQKQAGVPGAMPRQQSSVIRLPDSGQTEDQTAGLLTRYEELGIPKPETAIIPVGSQGSTAMTLYPEPMRSALGKIRPTANMLNIIAVPMIMLSVLAAGYFHSGHDIQSLRAWVSGSSRLNENSDYVRTSIQSVELKNDIRIDDKINSADSSRLTVAPYSARIDDLRSSTEIDKVSAPGRDAYPSLEWTRRALQRAEVQLSKGRLTTPSGNNAYETYKKILSAYPRNKEARYGLYKMKRIYQKWGLNAEYQGNLEKARSYYARALRVSPDDQVVATALQHVNKKLMLIGKNDFENVE
ncbi:MAG: AAA family ATPase [Methylococcaceae bacterium]|nr:AAA family ATPase [Methylococcaceae bacterium]